MSDGGFNNSRWSQFVFIVGAVIAIAVTLTLYGYIESSWFVDAPESTRAALHLFRATTIGVVLLIALVMYRSVRRDRVSAEAARTGLSGTLSRRIQRVSLRTKIVVPVILLAVVPTLLVGVFTIYAMRNVLGQRVIEAANDETRFRADTLRTFLGMAEDDLDYLANLESLRALVDAEYAGQVEGIESRRAAFASEANAFTSGIRTFYDVQYVDASGRAWVPMKTKNGEAELVPGGPADESRGARYSRRLESTSGAQRGYLTVEVFTDQLLSLMGPEQEEVEFWLVDSDGVYLSYTGASEAHQTDARMTLAGDFSDAQAELILGATVDAPAVRKESSVYFKSRIDLDSTDPTRFWVLLVKYPRYPIESPVHHFTVFLSLFLMLMIAIAATLGLFIGGYFMRPLVRLRRATRDIAAGDLDAAVAVGTGDEIEELADDFNVMTSRLRAAQEQLSNWNRELQEEVERQTESAHHLRSGLARADKLASLGLMTAAMTHEIGNPLAAIKTKIQVSQEEESEREQYGMLLPELLEEVDRLSAFLHSFARISQLREPSFSDVAPDQLVREVASLVEPELRRRAIRLSVHVLDPVPTMRGDANQIRQLLINLILNAEDASRAGQEIRIEVQGDELAERSQAVTIRVVDEGEGIKAENLASIWDPFYTTKPEGTGLGMSICREIVESHEGTVSVKSSPGQGTIITMTFPPKRSSTEAG